MYMCHVHLVKVKDARSAIGEDTAWNAVEYVPSLSTDFSRGICA